MLFTSGRPVIVIPPYWEGGVEFGKIMVAWDGQSGKLCLFRHAPNRSISCVSPLMRRKESPARTWRLTFRAIPRK
jgi:hypothetical protein